MRKFFTLFSALVFVVIYSCNSNHAGPSQEDFDRLSKQLIESEARIANLEDEFELFASEVDELKEQHEGLAKNKVSATNSSSDQTRQKWVDWVQLSGKSRKYYKGEPYTGGFTQYFSDRSKQLTGYYTNGYRSGKWTYYNKNGSVKDVRYY